MCAKLYNTDGGKQLTWCKLQCAPDWLLTEAMKEEVKKSWASAVIEVNADAIDQRATIICSHIVYKIKVKECRMRMKARLCPHRNRDKFKSTIWNDSPYAQFDIFRMNCSLTSMLSMRLSCVNMKGAYLQSGPIKREILVRPHKS